MRRPFFLFLFLLFASLAMPRPLLAAPPAIQACVTQDGGAVYTDKPCRTLGAQSIPMRGELMNRIAREQAREAVVSGVEVSYLPSMDEASMADARHAIGRRSAAGGCARSPRQLAMDLRGAVALGDVNRIAESFHWVGMSSRGANATMQRLSKLAKRPLVDAQYYGAFMASAGGETHGGSGGVLQLQFGGNSLATVQDLDVERYHGCWFVRF